MLAAGIRNILKLLTVDGICRCATTQPTTSQLHLRLQRTNGEDDAGSALRFSSCRCRRAVVDGAAHHRTQRSCRYELPQDNNVSQIFSYAMYNFWRSAQNIIIVFIIICKYLYSPVS